MAPPSKEYRRKHSAKRLGGRKRRGEIEERERDKRITNFSLLAFPSNIHIAGRNIDLAPSLVYLLAPM